MGEPKVLAGGDTYRLIQVGEEVWFQQSYWSGGVNPVSWSRTFGRHEYSAREIYDSMSAKLAESERQLGDWENREAACCPEDVGFEEYIASLSRQLGEARATIDRAAAWLGMPPGTDSSTIVGAIRRVVKAREDLQRQLYELREGLSPLPAAAPTEEPTAQQEGTEDGVR